MIVWGVFFLLLASTRLAAPAEPTLARLSFGVHPDRLAEFAPIYASQIAPLLSKRGLTALEPPKPPAFAFEVTKPRGAAVRKPLQAPAALLKAEMDQNIETNYLERLKAEPENEALRTRLLKVYLALHQFDTAIRTGQDYLIDETGDKARIQNELGIAYLMKGDPQLSAFFFKDALKLRPDDAGLKENLAEAMQALGRETAGDANSDANPTNKTESSGKARSAVPALEAESFYWIE